MPDAQPRQGSVERDHPQMTNHKDHAKSAEQLMAAMERVLREGHKVWEPHQNDPEWDHLSAALTAVYMAWGFAAHTGLLPHGPEADSS